MSQRQQSSPSRAYELLSTKLTPPRLHTALVARTPLLARLAQDVERKLTLLCAPAGYGKTTLVSQWVKQQQEGGRMKDEAKAATLHPSSLILHPAQVAWLSLDAGDNDPVRFWRYCIAAYQRLAPAIGQAALHALQTTSRPPWESLLIGLLNDLAEQTSETKHMVLVLEDYHVITASQVHETLTFFLEHLPATVHLIITTRQDPPLPLAQMRVRNELSELRALALRFSRAESQLFFQQALSLPLAPAAITYLAARTEGWIAGLHLAALALQKRPDPQAMGQFLATFRGTHEHIFTYLVAEVLHAQPAACQEFLLQTSVLGRLCGALCDAVTGRQDSEELLAKLAQANLFLSPFPATQGAATSDGAIWYRYHALFAEAMQQAARRQLGEEELRQLAQKASRWYEQHGLLTEAIESAFTAQEFDRAADLIESTLDPLNRNYAHDTLRRWIEPLPERVLHSHPTLAFVYAIAILFTSERRAPETMTLVQTPLQIAETRWLTEPDEHKLGAVLAFRALLAWLQGDLPQAFAQAHQALARLPEHEAQWRDICLIFRGVEELQQGHLPDAAQTLTTARALCALTGNEFGALDAALLLGDVLVGQGELQQAAELYHHVRNAAERAQMAREQALIRVSSALLGLSALAYEANALADAEQQATQALAISQQVGYVDLQMRAVLILARVDQARGDSTAAQQRLHALVAQITEPRWAPLLRRVRAEQARLALAARDLAAAAHWSTTVAAHTEGISRLQQEQEALILARLLLAQGEIDATLDLLDRWQTEAKVQRRTGNILTMLMLQSLAYDTAHQLSAARQALLSALRLAQPQGYQRLFLDEGERLARLLVNLLPSLREEPLRIYGQGLLSAFSNGAAPESSSSTPLPTQPSTPQLIEPLSERELDVLKLVAAGLATEEVARELVISIGTVRTHLKHIYGKLDAHSRVQAVERARALQLL